MNMLTKGMLRDFGREMYLKSISVWLSPSMRLARTFKDIQNIPDEILKQAQDIYESQFKDIVEWKIDERIKFERRMKQLYPDKNVMRPRVPNSILVSQPSVQADIANLSQQMGIHRWRILNPSDSRTCSLCREWIGRDVSDADGSLMEWKASGALHFGCRCSLRPAKEYTKDIQQRALEFLWRHQTIGLYESPSEKSIVII